MKAGPKLSILSWALIHMFLLFSEFFYLAELEMHSQNTDGIQGLAQNHQSCTFCYLFAQSWHLTLAKNLHTEYAVLICKSCWRTIRKATISGFDTSWILIGWNQNNIEEFIFVWFVLVKFRSVLFTWFWKER